MAWLTVATLWWLFFWTALGLCIGSFLNVVIYRLPRNKSLRAPLWSACPHCNHRIRWYDNLPILSFLRLRGRCRQCRLPISPRYLVIEALMAIVVLMLIDSFFIARIRSGLCEGRFGLTDQLTFDWPILLAHIILFACLFSMSAIDIEHYWVDVRFTNFATIAGFALHTIWTPMHSKAWPRPSDTTAVVCLFALVGLGVTWLLLACRPHIDPEDYGLNPQEDLPVDPFNQPPPVEILTSSERPSAVFALLAMMLLVALFVVLFVSQVAKPSIDHWLRGITPLAFMFLLIVRESVRTRHSDQQIIMDIHAERHMARSTVLMEFAMLFPSILLGCAALWLMAADNDLTGRFSRLLHERFTIHSIPTMRSWSPLYGFATAATGYIIGGALGWLIRIVFTLGLGKEAFGTGDIHMMAAAGCIAGWPIVVLGFFLTCGLAMIGWVLIMPFKRARALPLGPWLALSFLALVVFYEPIIQWEPVARTIQAMKLLAFGSAS